MQLLNPEFKHSDARRTLTQLFTFPIKQVNEYHAKKGAILGNHYHKQTTEFFHITKGTLVYNGDRILNKGITFVVKPGEKHCLECLTDVSMLTFLSKPYTKEDTDTYV